jgi:hypothetical protein
VNNTDCGKRGWFYVTATAIAALCVGACGAYAQKSAGAVNAKKPLEFVPAGYKVTEEVRGDLNKDGFEDAVLIIENKRRENLSGIIVAFGKDGGYEVALKNRDFFSYNKYYVGTGEPEWYAVDIKKGILIISTNGRASCCTFETTVYKFRYKSGDFELTGYDRTVTVLGNGIIIEAESVNLLSKKMRTKTNKAANVEDDDGDAYNAMFDHDAESGKEVFDEVWKDVIIKEKPLTLRNIKNFCYDRYLYMDIEEE